MGPESESRWQAPEPEDGVFGELTIQAFQKYFLAADHTRDPFEDAKSRSHFWVDRLGNLHTRFEDDEPVLTEGIKDWMRIHQPEPIPDDVLKSIDDAFHWDGK